ncbi:MAG TPA: amidohydrolase family protein, partial [Urbifossiella sp.]
AAAAAASASLASAKDETVSNANLMPIVDTHQHLWDLTKFKLAWFDPDSAEGKILGHNFTPKEYAEATKGLNVVKSVYMEVDVVPEQQQKEADYIIELCASGKTPTCAAVISGRPNSDGFARYARQFKGGKYVKGMRQVLHVTGATPEYFLDPKFVKGIQLLGELGLSFDLCARPEEIPDHIKLVDKCPGTRFILDHCGNAKLTHTPAEREQWKKNMTAIGKKKNVVGKVSGFIASAPARGKWTLDDLAPVINHTLDSFGPDRVMFGGDWPVCLLGVEKYADWLNALKAVVADRSEDQQKKLFHDNAVKFYGL